MGFTTRPVIQGTHGVVSSGHYLASAVALRILSQGGNAIDAGVAAGFALSVLKPQDNGMGGEVPILIYDARKRQVAAISGQGTAPRRATIEWFREQGISLIPGDGMLAATVPAAFGAWVTALARFGRLSLREVLTPAVELAADGFGMYPALQASIATHAERFRSEWPSTAKVYLPGGRVPQVGERFRQPDWAATFQKVLDAEERARNRGREAGLQAALDYFYRGDLARRLAEFAAETSVRDASGEKHAGLIEYDDLARYQTRVEAPVSTSYRGYQVYKCNTWTQGPVFLQQLNLLEGFNLARMGHNTPEYIHTVVEAAKLAFADRERYYGDPLFDQVPIDRLLSKGYAAERRALIDPARASLEMRPGDAEAYMVEETQPDPNVYVGDTTHVDVVDADGNMIAATPSGGWIPSSPVVEGLGFPLGTRAQMFFLEPGRPNALQPGKRPRTTLTPSLVLKDGQPHMVFGTVGGDQQDQWTLQAFLNYVDFGMSLQEAVDAPSFHTLHFPSSFYPRDAHPGRLVVEALIPDAVRLALAARGHEIAEVRAWNNGQVNMVRYNQGDRIISGAASPKAGGEAYALGY